MRTGEGLSPTETYSPLRPATAAYTYFFLKIICFEIYFSLFYVCGHFACAYYCAPCACSACSSQKVALDLLEPELQLVVSPQGDAGPSLIAVPSLQPFQLTFMTLGLRRLEDWGQDVFSLT